MKVQRMHLRVLISLIVIAAEPPHMFPSESARSFYKSGQAAEVRQDYDAAFDSYRNAMLEQPGDLRYRASCERVRLLASAQHVKRGNELRQNGQTAEAMTEFFRAKAIDPSNMAAAQAITSLEEHL